MIQNKKKPLMLTSFWVCWHLKAGQNTQLLHEGLTEFEEGYKKGARFKGTNIV